MSNSELLLPMVDECENYLMIKATGLIELSA